MTTRLSQERERVIALRAAWKQAEAEEQQKRDTISQLQNDKAFREFDKAWGACHPRSWLASSWDAFLAAE